VNTLKTFGDNRPDAEEVVQDVFGLAVKVVPDPVAGTPMVVPIGRHTTRTDPAAVSGNPAAAALAASAAANGVCRPAPD